MNWKAKLLYSQNWNIGFCEMSSDELLEQKSLNSVQWMKHPYKDRWFADPFILRVSADEIVVFVEECPIEKPKGILCELVLDRKTKQLKQRYVLLELDTHLSYPAIIKHDGKVYVYPENGQSGSLIIYEYDERMHKLFNPVVIVDEPLADATIWEGDNCFYLLATKYPYTQDGVFLYRSNSLVGQFSQVYDTPVVKGKNASRPGGNLIVHKGNIYRPFQDCSIHYGGALGISIVEQVFPFYSETEVLKLKPLNYRYNLGIHTINETDRVIVLDGYGYLYPSIARLLKLIIRIKTKILNNGR